MESTVLELYEPIKMSMDTIEWRINDSCTKLSIKHLNSTNWGLKYGVGYRFNLKDSNVLIKSIEEYVELRSKTERSSSFDEFSKIVRESSKFNFHPFMKAIFFINIFYILIAHDKGYTVKKNWDFEEEPQNKIFKIFNLSTDSGKDEFTQEFFAITSKAIEELEFKEPILFNKLKIMTKYTIKAYQIYTGNVFFDYTIFEGLKLPFYPFSSK